MLPFAEQRATGPNIAGDLRIVPFESRIFENKRMLRVWLPPGYDDVANVHRRYPVLFLNDGQNLFDSSTAVLNPMEWHVDETVLQLITTHAIPPLIVVGIDNAGRRNRFKEYFPWVDRYLRPPEPHPAGALYPSFVLDEVLPFVEQHYRVSRAARDRAIGGSSAGALAALFTIVTRPGSFGGLLVESPSLYVDDDHILTLAQQLRTWPSRIALGVGTNESNRATCVANTGDPELLHDVQRLETIAEQAAVDSSRILLTVTPCGRHDEAAWGRRLPIALRFLFGRTG